MTRTSWNIDKKVGSYWVNDGFIYRPNDIFVFQKLSTQSKAQRMDGQNVYMTPSTKYINENFAFVWYYDDGTMKTKIETYIENQTDLRIEDHNENKYTGRFISINPLWLVGESTNHYDIQAVFERMSLLTASSSSSSFSSSSSSSASI